MKSPIVPQGGGRTAFLQRDDNGLLNGLGNEESKLEEWRLFIDILKNGLKCVLLHNGNVYGSVALGNQTPPKKTQL